MSWMFFILVTMSSWCVTMLPDCRGVFSGGSCESSSMAGVTGVGVDGTGRMGVTGVSGGRLEIEGAFRFLLIFF